MFKEYGFLWKLRFWIKQGFYPQEQHIRFLQGLDYYISKDKKEKGDEI